MSSPSGTRRTPSSGGRPTARSGPGRPGVPRGARSPAGESRPGGLGQRGRSGDRSRPARPVVNAPRPRFTGRAAILVIVLAVLAVSYASSLRAYLQQREHLQGLQATIVERQAEIDALETEKKKWQDPQFIELQARLRLGLVRPGETPFVALRDGEPLDSESSLTDPSTLATTTPRAWWEDAWDSVLEAGDPKRRADPPPLTRVENPDGAPTEEDE